LILIKRNQIWKENDTGKLIEISKVMGISIEYYSQNDHVWGGSTEYLFRKKFEFQYTLPGVSA
jgi:hypothetical protein